MSTERPLRNWVGDVLIVLLVFAPAVLIGAAVVMSWIAPNPEPGGLPLVVMGLARFFGDVPLFLLCATAAWLASRFFLGGGWPAGIGRLCLAAALAAGGLALVLAGAWPPHGGALGQTAVGLFGGLLAAGLGLVLVAVPFWHLWLRPRALPERAFSDESAPPDDPDPESGAGGLSAAEADALLPKPPRAWPRPTSPYPVDVRLEGRIPEGAQPIQVDLHAYPSRAARRANEPADPAPRAVSGWAAPAWQAAEQPPGAHLAALPRDQPARAEAAGSADEADDEAELAAWRLPLANPAEEPPAEPFGDEADEIEAPERGPALPEPAEEALPAASWEQPGLFSDEEPVDAYGTPIKLVESLRRTGGEPAAPQELVAALDDHEEDPEDDPEDDVEDEPDEVVEELFAEDAEAADELEVELLPHRAEEPALPGAVEAPESELAESAAEPRAPAPAGGPEDELVYQAGVLLLERGRVAVSLLQREFKLDFDEATALLDRLQEAGLIGPYVGGQRRDILLTPEEWSEKQVGAS